MDKYFNKIFVISLYDKEKRWMKVKKQFSRRKIDVERFIAIDGRCKDQNPKGCYDKLKSFEISYNVKIPIKKGEKLKEMIPASSLSIGTLLLLREMVKKKWKRILICEDDIILGKNLEDRFKQGIKEIGNKRWDLLYLGSGNDSGSEGISMKSKKGYKRSFLSDYYYEDFYIKYKNDLRLPAEKSKKISEHISQASSPGGTWCYAVSLAGAKKILKLMDNNVANHIDQIYMKHTKKKELKSLAFDPPLVMHEDISQGRDTDIPWEM